MIWCNILTTDNHSSVSTPVSDGWQFSSWLWSQIQTLLRSRSPGGHWSTCWSCSVQLLWWEMLTDTKLIFLCCRYRGTGEVQTGEKERKKQNCSNKMQADIYFKQYYCFNWLYQAEKVGENCSVGQWSDSAEGGEHVAESDEGGIVEGGEDAEE